MNPKKSLPKDSVELERQDDYILIQHTLNKLPYYTVFRFFETTKGTRYIARGASSMDLERVRGEFERITGKKLAP
jgi:hypothetical protein